MRFIKLNGVAKYVLVGLLLACGLAQASSEKVALVIGNSKYESLGTLSNTANDAKGVDKVLREMGYKSKLVIDATDAQIRKEIKKFASDTDGASIAILFYAGHGAQVNGENYLLPVDMEAPQRESDIQISGFKVDDLLNSMKSSTKVVFLDACRDNPALMKSMVKGRGAYRGGLAPANTSSIDATNGVFIAYATSAGDIASDGEGQKNSPFTTALLKYVKEPVSIDDMFSKVTKEVKATTGNKQRPYKYASLDNVVCLPGACSKGGGLVDTQSQSPAFETQRKNVDGHALQTQPDNQSKVTSDTSGGDYWLIFESQKEVGNKPVALKPNSWRSFDERVGLEVKFVDPNPAMIPDMVDRNRVKSVAIRYAIDCKSRMSAIAESIYLDSKDEEISRTRYGSPAFIPLDTKPFAPGTLGIVFEGYACTNAHAVPIVPGSTVLRRENWESLYDIDAHGTSPRTLYVLLGSQKRDGAIGYVTTKVEAGSSTDFDKYFPVFSGVSGMPRIRSQVYLNKFDCAKREHLVYLSVVYTEKGIPVAITDTWTGDNAKPVKVTQQLEQLFNVACKR